MKDKEIKLSDISILSAHDVVTKLLLDFYNTMYPKRTELPNIWKWLNRSSFYDNKIPLVVLYNDRVIAHLGIIPFHILLDGKYFTATFGIDLVVLPEFQRRGIGSYLVKKWMELSDLYVGFPNESAIGIYKKHGWIESFHTYLHHYFLRPFNHPRFIGLIPKYLRWILNIPFRPLLYIIYHKNASTRDNIHLEDLNSDSLNKFMSSLGKQNNTVAPVRDSDYISWRLINSPDKDNYRVFTIDDVYNLSMIIKLCDKYDSKYIDILWVSNPSEYSAIRRMISTLAIWGMNNAYSHIRYFTASKELSAYLNKSLKSIVRNRRFVFYSKDVTLLEKLKHSNWHWELIDSDFEEF